MERSVGTRPKEAVKPWQVGILGNERAEARVRQIIELLLGFRETGEVGIGYEFAYCFQKATRLRTMPSRVE
jgi:hypothetical protein